MLTLLRSSRGNSWFKALYQYERIDGDWRTITATTGGHKQAAKDFANADEPLYDRLWLHAYCKSLP